MKYVDSSNCMTVLTMKTAAKFIFLIVLFPAFISSVSGSEQCGSCHTETTKFAWFHNPLEIGCTSCNVGNASKQTKDKAPQNLESYPGRMETVEKSCGQSGCHQNMIPIVSNSVMNTVDRMQIINKLLSILKKIRKI